MARVDYQFGEAISYPACTLSRAAPQNNPTVGGNQIVSYAGMQNYEGQYNGVASDTWTISATKVNSAACVLLAEPLHR